MREQWVKCDRCGKRIGNFDTVLYEYSVGVVVGRKTDAAGSMEDETDGVDLCHRCAIVELRRFVSALNHNEAGEWIKRVGKQ